MNRKNNTKKKKNFDLVTHKRNTAHGCLPNSWNTNDTIRFLHDRNGL